MESTVTRGVANGHTRCYDLHRMTLPELAAELKANDRTLRRAAEQGLLRLHRPSPRKVNVPIAERVYLRRHWNFLSDLRDALRTEPSVAFAVLFGSRARGDERGDSDVDLVVGFRTGTDRRELETRLARRLNVAVQIVDLEHAKAAPRLLAEVIREGRVIVDREEAWSRLTANRNRIAHAASRESRRIESEFEKAFRAVA
jgi:predicted nucleotidyltransferase